MKLYTLLISTILVASCGSNNKSIQEEKKQIVLQSNGEVEVAPDMASFNISIQSRNKDIEKSKATLITKSNELIKLLKEHNIKEEDIQSTNVRLNKSYDFIKGSRYFIGYNAETDIKVQLRDLNKMALIYTKLLNEETYSIGSLNYTHSAKDSLKNVAYMKALNKATISAEQFLQHMDGKELEIEKISNVKFSNNTPQLTGADYYYKAESDGNLGMSKGRISINASLYVAYSVR